MSAAKSMSWRRANARKSGQNREHRIAGPRLIAIVGPFQSGKTSLLESLLARGGGAARQGSVREGTSIGDSSPEARAHAMSVEPNVATSTTWATGSPSSIARDRSNSCTTCATSLPVCDAAVVVCEADPRKVPALQVILRELEELKSRASCSSTRSISPAAACARRWNCCSRLRARRCCCARFRSARTASPPASSIWRSSARSSTARRRPRK